MTTRVLVLGAGGTALDVLDAIDAINARRPTFECIGLLDDDPAKAGQPFGSARVVGSLRDAARWPDAGIVNALGSVRSFWRRPEIVERAGIGAERMVSVVHPSATLSPSSVVAPGAILLANVVISANAELGPEVTILANTVINHDVRIGAHTIIASGVNVSGRVRVGARCYLGTGSAIIQDATIGDECLIGMGSVVLRDVAAGSVMAGNPARRIRGTRDDA